MLKFWAFHILIYTGLTLPYVIWFVSGKEMGMRYPFWATILAGLISAILSAYLCDKNKLDV